MNPNFVPPMMDVTSSIEYFPYFDGHYLAVAASLTGGNVMFAFVKMLQQWTHELGRCCHLVDSNVIPSIINLMKVYGLFCLLPQPMHNILKVTLCAN